MNHKKHKILKLLFEFWKDGESKSGYGHTVTDLGRSMTTQVIHENTNIKISIVNDICNNLKNEEFLTLTKQDLNNKVYRYLITEKGKDACLNNLFLNQIWWRRFDFWKWFLPFLFGLFGTLNSVFHFLDYYKK